MERDLFGDPVATKAGSPELSQQQMELGRVKALDQLREEWRRVQHRADIDPEDETKVKEAAAAEAAFLGLKNYHDRIGAEELSVRARVDPEEPLPDDNGELFHSEGGKQDVRPTDT